MKNRTIFLSVVLSICLFTGIASAQFTEVWKVSPGTWPMMSTGDNTRGAALNRSNGHYLVTRRDIPRIYVYNATNGAPIDSLNMTGITGGTISLQDIEITSDGVIYGTNLVLNTTSDTTFKIYRWANDNSVTVPTVAYSGRPTATASARLGDAFDVAGTGTGTVIYVGGNASATNQIQVFTTADGSTFTRTSGIAITGQDAGAGISQLTPGGDFLTSRLSGGQPIRLYNSTGGRKDAVPTTVTPAFQADVAYLEAAGRKWIASSESVSTAGAGKKGVLLNTTYGLSGAVKVGATPVLGTNVNTGSTGADVEMQYNAADSSMTLYLMVDNNGFAAYKSGNLLLANLPPFGGNIVRSQFVPLTGVNDTVFVDVQDDQFVPTDSVKLNYSVTGGANTVVSMTRISGDSIIGKYRGIIPGAVNTNGARIAYNVTVADNQGVRFTGTTSGYFAGITKMTLAGPRALDTSNGVILWSGFGIRVQGVCVQEDSLIAIPTSRHDVVLQDETGAMDFIEFAVNSVAPPWGMKRGRLYTAAGLIGQFNGKIQVAIPATGKSIEVTDNGPGVLPAPKLVTVRDLAFDRVGELHENALVRLSNLRLTQFSLPWPAANAPGTNITVTDNGVDTLTLRVPALSSANGFPPLRQPFTALGIAGQFDVSSPFKGDYQIILRHLDDLFAEVPVGIKDTTKAFVGAEIILPVNVGNITGLGITGFEIDAQIDSTALQLVSVSNLNSVSSGSSFSTNVLNKGMVKIAASGAAALKDSGSLFTVRYKILKLGASMISLNGRFNEGNPFAIIKGGVVVGMMKPPVPPFVLNNANLTFGASLDTAQAGSGGRKGIGTGAMVLSEDRNELMYQVTVSGLSGTISQAHFHSGAPGVAGGVVKNITFNGQTAYGFWRASDATQPLTPALLADLLTGKLYLNVHTSTFSGGEIRGQIYPGSGVAFAAVLDSTQAKTSSTANGTAAVFLTADRSTIKYSVTYDGLEGNLTASHFHNAPADSNGGVVKDITLVNGTAIGEWKKTDGTQPLTDQMIAELMRGRLYINIHSSQSPGGEIRGQVRLVGGYGLAAMLDSAQAGTNKPGRGTALFHLKGQTDNALNYRITVSGLSGAISDAHIHLGAKGVAGPVVKPLNFFGNTATGSWSETDSTNKFSDSLFAALIRGRLYVNVHTAAHPGGEIRGQIELTTGFGIAVGMDNAQAGKTGNGRGTGWVTLSPNQDELSYNVTVNDLTGAITNSHFHSARRGISGGVVKNMTFTNGNSTGSWKASDGTQPLTNAMVDSLFSEALYVNVHTALNSGGEIRGQVSPGKGSLSSVKRISDIVPSEFALEQNYPNPFNPTTMIQFALPNDASVSLKIYDVLGREVRTLINSDVAAGTNTIEWNGKNNTGTQVASGMYIYRIEAGSFISTKKMMLLK